MGEFRVEVVKEYLKSEGYVALDITELVSRVVRDAKLARGVAVVYTPCKGCSVTMIEYEPELLRDLEDLLSGACGGLSGVGEVLVGKSVAVPVDDYELILGTFKRVVFLDFSRESGKKEVVVALEGLFE